MGSLTQNIAKTIECAALIAGVFIAANALSTAKDQITSSNISQKEATAQQAYSEYLKLAIENPKLAAGLPDSSENFDEKKSQNDEEIKYPWFVSYFLNAGEQIYLSSKGDKEWEHTIRLQVCYHKKFFLGPDWNEDVKNSFNPSYIKLIESGIEWCGFKKGK